MIINTEPINNGQIDVCCNRFSFILVCMMYAVVKKHTSIRVVSHELNVYCLTSEFDGKNTALVWPLLKNIVQICFSAIGLVNNILVKKNKVALIFPLTIIIAMFHLVFYFGIENNAVILEFIEYFYIPLTCLLTWIIFNHKYSSNIVPCLKHNIVMNISKVMLFIDLITFRFIVYYNLFYGMLVRLSILIILSSILQLKMFLMEE